MLKNSLSLQNDQIGGIENVSENRERRLYGILTRFYFCEFLGREFFNSHACLRQDRRGCTFVRKFDRDSHGEDHASTTASFQDPTVLWIGSARAGCGPCSRNNGTQTTKDHDEECLGIGRPDESGLSILARACACRSRA